MCESPSRCGKCSVCDTCDIHVMACVACDLKLSSHPHLTTRDLQALSKGHTKSFGSKQERRDGIACAFVVACAGGVMDQVKPSLMRACYLRHHSRTIFDTCNASHVSWINRSSTLWRAARMPWVLSSCLCCSSAMSMGTRRTLWCLWSLHGSKGWRRRF